MFAFCVCVGGGERGGDDLIFCSLRLSFPGHGRLRSLGGKNSLDFLTFRENVSSLIQEALG